MIGILIQLALSWLLVWLFDRSNLSVLGFRPTKERLKHFIIFLLTAAAFSASGFGLKMWIAEQRWQLNPDWTVQLIADGVWFNIKSVLYEELIFRGALFYILIKKVGATKAIWISSTAFGMYHWFSQGSLGEPIPMLITFVVTGTMGLVLAYGYTKTQSLYVPIAIHFGWNVVQQVVFSNGPIGKRLLTEVLPQPEVTVSYFTFFFMQLFPIVGVLVVCALGIRYSKS
ncbi:MAG: lysostaphin resistance A-like protein [Cyclobacteriaceae bacterium]|jgi:membrane protease YdiL (CAAX protease family)|nr:CPBP family intramembrane metalloprotease [Flammeovirgaceae bacterium]